MRCSSARQRKWLRGPCWGRCVIAQAGAAPDGDGGPGLQLPRRREWICPCGPRVYLCESVCSGVCGMDVTLVWVSIEFPCVKSHPAGPGTVWWPWAWTRCQAARGQQPLGRGTVKGAGGRVASVCVGISVCVSFWTSSGHSTTPTPAPRPPATVVPQVWYTEVREGAAQHSLTHCWGGRRPSRVAKM